MGYYNSSYNEAVNCKCGCKERYVLDFWFAFGVQSWFRYMFVDNYTLISFIKDAPSIFFTSTAMASYKFRYENADRQCKEDLLCIAQGMIFSPNVLAEFV